MQRVRPADLITYTIGFLVGALALSLLSIPQKLTLGADPFIPKGFIVPILFGGVTGLILSILHHRVRQENQRLKKVHHELESIGLQYKSYFNNNHAVMLLIDPATADIMDANPAACEFYGYDKPELTRLKISDLNTLSKEEVFQEMDRAKSQNRKHFNFKHRLAGGEIREVEVFSGPIAFGGRDLLYSIIHDVTDRLRIESEREELIDQLRDALANIKTLSGLLPICSNCKKIRDDTGYWQQIEEYISAQSEAQFSHGICPECRATLYPELDK